MDRKDTLMCEKNPYFHTLEAIKEAEGMSSHDLTNTLRKMIHISGFTQAQLSEKSGIHINNIQKWMSGKGLPSYLNLIACINAMGFDIQFKELEDEEQGKEGN